MRFPRQEHWSGLPFPSPMHEMKSESEVAQSCLTLSDPTDCSLPGSSVHGIFQARVHRRIAQKRSSWPRWSWWCDHSPRARHPGMWSQRALGSITTNIASGDYGIPVEFFQILKDDALKVLHSICQQIWKTQQWSQDWKRSVFIPIPKKGNAKECFKNHTIALISHASKVMLEILQARLQ